MHNTQVCHFTHGEGTVHVAFHISWWAQLSQPRDPACFPHGERNQVPVEQCPHLLNPTSWRGLSAFRVVGFPFCHASRVRASPRVWPSCLPYLTGLMLSGLIRMAARIRTTSPLMGDGYCILRVITYLLFQSSIYRHFFFLALMNNAVGNPCVQVFV